MTPEDPERARVEAIEPPSPFVTRSVRDYTADATCGQGPYRIQAPALGARFGEHIEVDLCAPRSVEGDFRFTSGTDASEPQHLERQRPRLERRRAAVGRAVAGTRKCSHPRARWVVAADRPLAWYQTPPPIP